VNISQHRFFELAAKFLSNEASKEEIASLYSYLEKEEYYLLFNKLKEEWEKSGTIDIDYRFDIFRGLDKLSAKIKKSEPFFSFDKKKRNRNTYAFIKYAAAAIVFISVTALGIYYSGILTKKSEPVNWVAKSTMMGEKAIITLIDNTQITLNAGTSIKYPANFTDKKREIYLEGEAYFEVQHDSSRPFIIHTRNLSTTVLGTKFDISAFPDQKQISVSLVEGSVKVTDENSGTDNNVFILKPKEKLVFNEEIEVGNIERFDIQETIGWKDNLLKFTNEPLVNVFKQLERKFGIKFEVANKLNEKRVITANFHNETLWTVTEVLKKITGLQYKTIKENNETKKIIFYKK
jgi:transmembrane sensor